MIIDEMTKITTVIIWMQGSISINLGCDTNIIVDPYVLEKGNSNDPTKWNHKDQDTKVIIVKFDKNDIVKRKEEEEATRDKSSTT